MSHQLEISVRTVDEKVKFACKAESKPEIITDFYPPLGTGEGYTSLELLLTSLATCLTTVVLGVLRNRFKKSVSGASVKASGRMRDEHPRILDLIELELVIVSDEVTEEQVKQALDAAEQQICPVWAMLKGNTNIGVNFSIKKSNR